jgi:hypothetical protein
MANVALHKLIEEPITNPSSATDGLTEGYSSTEGFAEFSWPYTLTVDLEKIYSIVCVRLLLWDDLGEGNKQRSNRLYKYRLLISIDHLNWQVIYDSSADGGNGWQVFNFPSSLDARYIRIHGIWNSANPYFQVVQIEAHDSAPSDLDAEIMLQRTVLSDCNQLENGDGLPLQARVAGIINRIERLVENNELLNPVPFRQLILQLRNQVSDVASLEKGMDSIRREIITPVQRELQQSARLNRFSVWGFWVGILGGILAILSLAIPLWQEIRKDNNLRADTKSASAQPTSTRSVVADFENNNAPTVFSIERKQPPLGRSYFTRNGDVWVQQYANGSTDRFPLSARVALNGCIGSLVYLAFSLDDVEEFFPDKGCGTMEVLRRKKKGRWESLGSMENVH